MVLEFMRMPKPNLESLESGRRSIIPSSSERHVMLCDHLLNVKNLISKNNFAERIAIIPSFTYSPLSNMIETKS